MYLLELRKTLLFYDAYVNNENTASSPIATIKIYEKIITLFAHFN